MGSHFFRLMMNPVPSWTKVCESMFQCGTQELERLLAAKLDPNACHQTDLKNLMPGVRQRVLVQNYVCSENLTVSPLHVSVLTNNEAACDLLLRHGADVRVEARRRNDQIGTQCLAICSVFHLTVVTNNRTILKSLIDGTNGDTELLNVRDMYNLTPLDQALKHNSLTCAELLLASGATFALDDNNCSRLTVCDLIDSCATGSDYDLIHMVLDCEYSAGGDIMSHFLTMMNVSDDCDAAFRLMDRIAARPDFSPNSRNGPERSGYMHQAALHQSVRLLDELVAIGVKMNANFMGENALHVAARQENTTHSVIKRLIELGCDKNQLNLSGNSPLAEAIQYSNTNAILILMEEDCEQCVTRDGYNGLHFYVNYGGTAVPVLRQLAIKYDVNDVTKYGSNALHLLVNHCPRSGQKAAIVAMRELMRLGVNVLAQNSSGDSVLMVAIVRSLDKIISELLFGMAKPVSQALVWLSDSTGLKPLHAAILNLSLKAQTVIDIMRHGADVNARDKLGRTTLFFLFSTEYAPPHSPETGRQADGEYVLRFKSIANRRNIFSVHQTTTTERKRMWDILDFMLNNTDIDVNCALGAGHENALNIAFARGEYALMQKLLIRADVSLLNPSRFNPHPGMFDMCKLLHQKGFRNFEPIIFKLRQIQTDTYQMRVLPASDRQEIWSLLHFLVSNSRSIL